MFINIKHAKYYLPHYKIPHLSSCQAKVHHKEEEEVSDEEISSEEDLSEVENITEEPLNEESSTDPINFGESEDLPAPARVFRRISRKYRGYF